MMDYGFGVWGIVSTIVTSLIGGGFVGGFLTVRAQKKKANAEAKGAEATAKKSELENVEDAITIWRETAESLKVQRDDALLAFNKVAEQVEALRRDVQKLNCTNGKILKLLDKISHENLEKMVEEIKNEIKKSDAQ